MRVQAVLSGRALRLGVAEAALPGAQRVRADVEDGSRFGCLQRSHGRQTASKPGALCAGSAQLARDFRFRLCNFLTAFPGFISVFSADCVAPQLGLAECWSA